MARRRRTPAAGLAGSRGQVLTLYSMALPALLAMVALALDGGKLFVHKQHMQNAADAAALAAVQEIGFQNCSQGPSATCDGAAQTAVLGKVRDVVNCFSRDNNAPAGKCALTDPFAAMEKCDPGPTSPSNTNCFNWPYIKYTGGVAGPPDYDKVEVRVRETVSLSFGGLPGIPDTAHPAARAVASYAALLSPGTPGSPAYTLVESGTTIPGTEFTATTVIDGTTVVLTTVVSTASTTTIPGATHTTTNVTLGTCTGGGNCGVAFAKSTECPAITYNGAGGDRIGSLMTNGGFTVLGSAGKIVEALYLGRYGQSGCYVNPGRATVNSGPFGPFSPQDWPNPLPNPPTPVPLSQPTLVGNQCWNISASGPGAATKPGVYCSTNAITVNQNYNGYTWFAPCISVSGNTHFFQYYGSIPASQGARQQTLFYASGDAARCGGAAIQIQGQTNTLNGDMFAPNGEISMQGGGVAGGVGFLEAQTLAIAGNFASYRGTGPLQGGSVVVVTTTDPATTTTISGTTTLFSTTTSGGSTSTYSTTSDPTTLPPNTIVIPSTPSVPGTTIGTTIGLGE